MLNPAYCAHWEWVCHTLYDWQSLLGGLLALLAGLGTMLYLRIQIGDERTRHIQSQQAKSLAARSTMPEALSAICNYVEAAARYMIPRVGGLSQQPPLPSAIALSDLRTSVEFLDDRAARHVAALLQSIQIVHSRVLSHKVREGVEYRDRTVDLVRLQLKINRLFPFARLTADAINEGPPTDGEMHSAFYSAGAGNLEPALATSVWNELRRKFPQIVTERWESVDEGEMNAEA